MYNYVNDQMLLMHQIRAEENVAKIDMDPKKLLKKRHPNSMQDIIKDVMPLGYILSLPQVVILTFL